MGTEAVLVLALATFAAFTVSSAVGLGGSLVLVPALVIALGPRHGVALAALLLAINNVVKVFAYRATLPVRKSLVILVCTIVGAAVGALLLTRVDETVVVVAVIASLVGSFALERFALERLQRRSAPALALASGATSGFSGTSGPLKGVAVKNLGLDRLHGGAASIVSLGGDLTKTTIFIEAGLLDERAWQVAAMSVPLMILGDTGRAPPHPLARERRWTALFWATMIGYAARLVLA